MHIKKVIFLKLFLFTILTNSFSQANIVINDQIQFLNDQIDNSLIEKFEKAGINYSFSIHMKTPCDYYYTVLDQQENSKRVTIENCKKEVIGSLNLLQKTAGFSDQDYASMLYFKILDIIQNPFVYVVTEEKPIQKEVVINKEQEIKTDTDVTQADEDQEELATDMNQSGNQHDSRYFFSPSSYNLKKGELYYNTIYFVLHDIQYGVTDHFSVGMGTSILGIPFYITPKFSYSINEKNHIAVGDMMMFGTWGVNFVSNLAYATYTYGSRKNNMTLGLGYFSATEGDLFNQKFNQPVVSFSAMAQLSPYIYFITENYFIHYKGKYSANYSHYNDSTGEYSSFYEDYSLNTNLLMGFTGFRLINKNKDIIGWQFGLTYFARMMDDIPPKYSGSDWYTSANGLNALMIPSVSYTHKFGKKY
ncbi:MAG: hypothetical protein ISR55_03470 [Bacteroidetes bacterium]|nr:hypothetical protein [Bacteroidota bacterium]